MAELRQPDAWESSAAAPFLSVGHATVTALGQERFLVAAPGREHEVRGIRNARALAHDLADGGGDSSWPTS
jgi:hypothetical protein